LAAVVILTVGMGANVIVFTLAKAVLFDAPPAVAEPSELVSITWTRDDGGEGVWSYPDYEWVREEGSAFSGVLAYLADPLATAVASSEGSSQASAWVVSDNYFAVLGSPMTLGRGFLPEEGLAPRSHPVVVLSHGFWERHYGADSGVVGGSLSLNGTTFTVVGVAHRDFRGISPVEAPPDLYVPLMMQGVLIAGSEHFFERRDNDISTWYRLVGRLGEGVSTEAAQAHMVALKTSWDAEFAGWIEAIDMRPFRLGVSTDYRFDASQAESLRRMIGFLGMVVASVLLIACANLALLLLARAPARRGEMGVRAALGAGRGRIVRQLLTEATLLAGLGGLGGLAVAYWGAGLVAAMMPYSFAADFTPDGTVLLFTGAVTLLVAAIFSLAPALRTAVSDIAGVLRGEARVTPRSRARNVLVVGQIAASVVLVAGAGLFVRSSVAAHSVELGIEPGTVLVTRVSLANHGYDEVAGRAFVADVLARARALPGVEVASVTTRPPFTGRWTSTTRPEGTAPGEPGVTLYFNRAGPQYFEVMGIPVVEGRAIDDRDIVGAAPALMLNETTAARLWPGRSAVGRTIEWRDRTWTVVGVAADAKYYTLGDDPVSQVYVPPDQDFDPALTTFVLRTSVPPLDIAPAMEAAILNVDDAVALAGTRSLEDLVDGQTASYRAMAVLAGMFGAIALLLAAIGLYSVLAYLVSQSSREIGIRMVLGAQSREVASSVLRRGSVLAVAGTAIGLGLAWLLAGLVREMLFGVEPQDPVTLSVAVVILMGVALLASYLPARRASRVDPAITLREA
jgi:predicted permease